VDETIKSLFGKRPPNWGSNSKPFEGYYFFVQKIAAAPLRLRKKFAEGL